MSDKSFRILGVDPGSLIMGYAVIDICNKHVTVLDIGYLDVSNTKNFYMRLKEEQSFLQQYVKLYNPSDLAIESQFFSKNAQAMIKIVRAQTIAISVALENGISVYEYAPLKIKMAITHNGRAEKFQVADMLQRFLTLPQDFMLKKLDATDALAVAYCHYLQKNSPVTTQQHCKDWKTFAKAKGLI